MPRLLVLLAPLLLAIACGGGAPDGVDRDAEVRWEAFNDNPNPGTYGMFVQANSFASVRHGNPDDALGVFYQVRAVEAHARLALTMDDEQAAREVVRRVEELETSQIMEAYEEALAGCTERFRAARESVRDLAN